ncbi:hypothetical protein DPEC_G00046100 [Dallia pectoralis]|uniref:Uncharacterized protein n=1 Tax=Dallia pectoralis TaxID=75939 RepID=A0ACC2H9T8_DALPE|nr:hypothetical protein DPEC_G00046100 [Dallia pectoralis]
MFGSGRRSRLPVPGVSTHAVLPPPRPVTPLSTGGDDGENMGSRRGVDPEESETERPRHSPHILQADPRTDLTDMVLWESPHWARALRVVAMGMGLADERKGWRIDEPSPDPLATVLAMWTSVDESGWMFCDSVGGGGGATYMGLAWGVSVWAGSTSA